MPVAAGQWDAFEVLDIDPESSGFTCVGHAKTQGRRCHNIIAKGNRSAASKALRDMSEQSLRSTNFDRQLESLACRLLCRRWHQGQSPSKVEQWKRKIDRFRAVGSVPQTPREINERSTSNRDPTARSSHLTDTIESLRQEIITLNERYMQALQLAEAASVTSASSLRITTHLQSSITTSVTVERTQSSHVSEHADSISPARPPVFETVAPESNHAESTQNPQDEDYYSIPSRASTSHTLSTDSETTTSAPVSQADSENEPQIGAQSSVEQAISVAQGEAISPSQETLPDGQIRRRIEGECSICCEDVVDGNDIAWCKARCGQNFHADCIAIWLTTQEGDSGMKTCPYW